MEASIAGTPAAADAQPEGTEAEQQGTEQEAGEQEQAPAVDLAPVEQRLDEMGAGMRSLLERFQGEPEGEGQGAELEPEPEPEDFLDPMTGDFDRDKLNSYINGQIGRGLEQGLREHVGPLAERLGETEQFLINQELDSLAVQYPQLQNEETATELTNEVKAFAEARGIPGLATDPEFVEMAYLATVGREAAQQETPAGEGAPDSLETGGGAAPAQHEGDPAQEILRAGGGGGPWGR